MAWLRRLLNQLRSDRLSSDIEREIAFHIAETADELAAAGMPRAQALREARRRFGNRTLMGERTRGVNLVPWMETFVADARYALRTMRRTPVVTVAVVLSLALGIGATTAIFTLIDVVMLRPLPVDRPEELRYVISGRSDDAIVGSFLSNPLFEEFRARQDVFTAVAAVSTRLSEERVDGDVRRLMGSWVSGEFFSLLGVTAALGRTIQPSDDHPGCPAIAVLGHGFWQRRFGGDREIVGRRLVLDGHPFEIVGVAPPGFYGVWVGDATSHYVPLCAMTTVLGARSALGQRNTFFLRVLGRVRPGLTDFALSARLSALAPVIHGATIPERWTAEQQRQYAGSTLRAEPAGTGFSRLRARYGPALVTLGAIVVLVLLVACANVANLLLARAASREREIAVRLAIGAGRGRLARQFLTEGVLLALMGAALGLLFARWSTELLVRFISTRFTVISLDLSPDARVLTFALVVAIAVGCLFALAPAWRATRADLQAAMGSGGRTVATGAAGFRFGNALVVGQVALSFTLLTGAALLIGTWWKLDTLDAGFARDHVVVASVDLRQTSVPAEGRRTLYDEMLRRLRALPGVAAAGATDIVPVTGNSVNDHMVVEGFVARSQDDDLAWQLRIGAGYIAAMRTGLLAGREFGAEDTPGSPPVAIVNETMARKFFGEVDVVGREFRRRISDTEVSDPIRIVGVMRDAKYQSLREQNLPTYYLPLEQGARWSSGLQLVVRANAAPDAVVPHVRRVVREVAADASVDLTRLETIVAESIVRERLLATVSAFFGAVALLLAVVGLYGIVSYQVTRTRRDLGVRMALGAGRPAVFRRVLGHVGLLVAFGLTLGALGALTAARLLSAFLYGIEPSDPRVLVVAAATLAAAALVAGALPARRAAGLDPAAVLREDA